MLTLLLGCHNRNACPNILALFISLAIMGSASASKIKNVEFNTDVLDVIDQKNIDLSKFSRSNFIMPGEYIFTVYINKRALPDKAIHYYTSESDQEETLPCISPQIVEHLGLKEKELDELTWWHQGQCLDVQSLDGISVTGDIGTSSLYLNIPQAYLEYIADNWDPPALWDDGIAGVLFDYSLNGQSQFQNNDSTKNNRLSGNGTVGGNIGSWRLRADWQANMSRGNAHSASNNDWNWTRYYAYRAISSLGSKLVLGENYLYSDIFDSFRFSGISLVTDDNMLPPNLRGYAPEVVGVAHSNAKVVILQQGRVLYETQVASGPFRIRDLSDAVNGKLDVRIEEQDGSVQIFQIDTASIPYLTRPGSLRYKVSAGRPTDIKHRTTGQIFSSGEFSWGVSNGWSLYGGSVLSDKYDSFALGLGRDLTFLGAVSLDVTRSHARLAEQNKLTGDSYRLSYSKKFDEYDNQITFAGYRFSQRDFMSMGDYLDARVYGSRAKRSKEMYTITFNQQVRSLGTSIFLDYAHQTYWDRPTRERYQLSVARYFDAGRFKNLNLSLSAYRNNDRGIDDDGMYFSISMPWGTNGNLTYSGSIDRKENIHQVGYFDRLNERDTYQVTSGLARNGITAGGYYTHQGDFSQVNLNANYSAGKYSSVGISMQGGATATLEGAAFHRNSTIGGTRMLLDTDGVANIPIRGSAPTHSNIFGKAVVVDMTSYYRTQYDIDVNSMPDEAEAIQTVAQATLTEGAIGYRHFDVLSGQKIMATIRLADSSFPPFGASVLNSKKQEIGIVSENGSVYLSGVNAGEKVSINWGTNSQCMLEIPELITLKPMQGLLLLCSVNTVN